MSLPPEVQYLHSQILNHLKLFFVPKVTHLFDSHLVRFLPYNDAIAIKEKIIAIPYDIPISSVPVEPYKVDFSGTKLTIWNRIEKPQGSGWSAIPNEFAPLWYRHKEGTLIPAWNLFGNLLKLLTFGEEAESIQRDSHGRFVAAYSPRKACGLLEVPAFNEATAVLAAGCLGLQEKGEPFLNLKDAVKAPVISLSHDCDVLYGNDFWTQAVRAFRVIEPLRRLRFPKLSNIRWIAKNAVIPRRFYFDNVTGMIDLERSFGFTSTFYLLNGTAGRFGARNGFKPIPELCKVIPPHWGKGIHYNYDTFLNSDLFASQYAELQSVINTRIISGRAHYLRFDPDKSFSFLSQFGIRVDESSGFSDFIGYRNGIAGCFQVFDRSASKTIEMWEVPMTIMDATIVRQYGDDALKVYSAMMHHLSRIGGAMTVLFHPGAFYNPEFPEMIGIYHNILMESRRLRARSLTAAEMINQIKDSVSA